MKLTTLMLIIALVQASARGYSQKITLHQKGASLASVLQTIKNQTGYVFISNNFDLENTKVSIDVKNASLDDALKSCFKDLPLSYKIIDKTVVIEQKEPFILDKLKEAMAIPITVSGKVTDTTGTPLPGATVKNITQNTSTSTIDDGTFLINAQAGDKITITFIGYDPYKFTVTNNVPVQNIVLHGSSSNLNAVQVIGYGQTTKRYNTGSVSTISSVEIEKQPVTNILSALSGRMPGVFVQTTNGLPGGGISIQIRGQNSIRNNQGNNGNYPLYIVDGVPFSSEALALDATQGAYSTASLNGTANPFNSLNPEDIESINILKDADATAIYGSRGANGVVLITTKKGKAGSTKVDINYNQGISRVANYPQQLNLDQYLQIRREAFKNDGLTPSTDPTLATYSPELTVWSQNQSTNWAKFIMGNTAATTDLQTSLSGGTDQTQFIISGNYRHEGSVLFGVGSYQRAGIHLNLTHSSIDKNFNVQFSSSYNGDNNILANPYGSFMADVFLPPNYPLYDMAGNLNWYISNPLADIKAKSKTQTSNFISNAIISYNIASGLTIKTSVGYSKFFVNQLLSNPSSAQNPATAVSSANFSNGNNQSIIVEPQITYTKIFNQSSINILLGGTYQNSSKNTQFISATNFSNDALIENVGSANTILANNSGSNYKYESVFARVTYKFDEKYILNASVRRDGSSRFGPGDQFGNFGAIGGAWIFTNETFIKDYLPFLSFGKLRASYGITGNDQIKDYQYLSTYASSGYVYQGTATLKASQISNANLHWETNKKLEQAIELGFFKGRISLTIDHYQNRSSDQLIAYTLPYITGFANYQANLPAIVQNTGWEFELNTTNVSGNSFSWKTTFNMTIPKNRLISFPGLAGSSYANTLAVGQDLSQGIGYLFSGVDPTTGVAQYPLLPGTTSPDQFYRFGQTSPYFYGGIGNSLTYKNWQFDVFGQFTKQFTFGGLGASPGGISNDYSTALGRWQKSGDIVNVPKASTISDYYYAYSTANWFNSSYFRVKNVSLSYVFPTTWLKSKKINRLRIYLQGQNVFTIWKKQAGLYDPETGAYSLGTIPIAPMKSYVVGIQITL